MKLKDISIEDLYLFKDIKKVQILPGKRYLFEEQKLNKKENKYNSAIFLQGDEDTEPKQFTSGSSQDQSMKLSPNKESIAFLSQRGGEKEKPQLYIMPIIGGESIKYTSMPNGVHSFNWSLDGKKVIFSSRVNLEEQSDEDQVLKEKDKPQELSEVDQKVKKLRKEEAEKDKVDPRVIQKIVYRQGTSFMDDKISHFYILDLETRESNRITKGEFNYISAVLNKDGTKLYAAKQKEDGPLNDLYEFIIEEISIETKEIKELKSALGFGTNLSISPNGLWLAYDTILTTDEASTQNAEIKLLNTESGLEKIVTESVDNHAFSALFDSKTDYLYFVVDDWERNILYRYSIERETLEKVVFGDYLILSYDVDAEQGLILLNISNVKEPSKLIAYDYVYKVTKTLWESNKDWLKERTLAITEETRYTGDSQQEVQGWIIKPPNFDANKKHPLILEIHGGPHATWSPHERSMWFEFQYFAAQGYVIFYCNPQGSSGRGYDFRYIIANWGTKPANDILMGLDQAVAKVYVDENNLFITGGSYGGYMTAWIIGNDKRFKAAAPQRGVYNLVSFWSTTDITQFTKDESGAFPWEDLDVMWKLSPIAYIDKVQTPTRIIHSENDFRVPISQGEEYFASLLKLGIEAELIRYPEEGHELSRSGKPKHVQDRLEKIIDWFNRYKK